MKKLVSLCLVFVLSVSVFAGCGDGSKEVLETPTQGVTELSELEKALGAFISENASEKKVFSGLKLSYKDESSMLNSCSVLDDLKDVIPKTREVSEDYQDLSIYDRSNPNINGVEERVQYKRIVGDWIGNESYFWTFFADSDADDGCIKWLELDSMAGFIEDESLSVNDISLSTPFSELLSLWGTPDYYGAGVKYSEDIVTVSWGYDLDKDGGSEVCVYVCISGISGTDFSSAFVHDMYVDMKVGS